MEDKVEKLEEGKTEAECPHKEPIYYDKYGRRLFGTRQPSAFAVAHPWPPIPTNLGKKQVLRRDQQGRPSSEDSIRYSSGKNSHDHGAGPGDMVYVPKNVSDIELALYWDRVPKVERLDTLTCPVHGEVFIGKPVVPQPPSYSRRRPSSLPPSFQRQNESTLEHCSEGVLGGPKAPKKHEKVEEKADSPEHWAKTLTTYRANGTGDVQKEKAEDQPKIEAKNESRNNGKTDENNNIAKTEDKGAKDTELEEQKDYEKQTEPEIKDKRETGEQECATMAHPPVKVTSTKACDKKVQFPDKDFYHFMMTRSRPTFFCPLHGSYLNGIRRRNTPRFRTILFKDQQIQADLQIRADPCGKLHDHGGQSHIDVQEARKIGNFYSKWNAIKLRKSRSTRDKEHTEYQNVYKNPKQVAEYDRLNNRPLYVEDKRLVRSKSSYLRR